jgi:hypothetical protein
MKAKTGISLAGLPPWDQGLRVGLVSNGPKGACHAALKCRNSLHEAIFRHLNPELAHLFVLKSLNETGAYKGHIEIYALISRTNFSKNFVRVLCAVIRDFSAGIMHLYPGKRLKTNRRDSGI